MTVTWWIVALAPFAGIGVFVVAKFCIAGLAEFTRGAKIGFRAYQAQQPKAVVKARLEELGHRAEQKRIVVLSPSARDTRH